MKPKEWQEVARRNQELANPFDMMGVGELIPFHRLIPEIVNQPEHTMFRALDVPSWTVTPRRAYYVFRCTCYAEEQYESSVFQHDYDVSIGYRVEETAYRDLVSLFLWLGNHGLTDQSAWQIVPTLEGYKP